MAGQSFVSGDPVKGRDGKSGTILEVRGGGDVVVSWNDGSVNVVAADTLVPVAPDWGGEDSSPADETDVDTLIKKSWSTGTSISEIISQEG